MDFLKSSKRRSLLSESAYVLLNVGLAVVLLLVVLAVNATPSAFVIFFLSKWRIFAVRPRYWFANIQANLVDIIVGIGFIILLHGANGSLAIQIILTLLYIGWLLFIKPRSKRSFVALQAGISVVVGISALMMISYDWSSSIVVLGMWLIGYAAARHVLSSYDEPHRLFYSLIWGLIMAELGWLSYHWTFAYEIPGLGGLQLSQAALVGLALSFLGERVYSSYRRHDEVRSSDVILPALLTVSVIVVVMIFFNVLGRGTI